MYLTRAYQEDSSNMYVLEAPKLYQSKLCLLWTTWRNGLRKSVLYKKYKCIAKHCTELACYPGINIPRTAELSQ